MLNKFLWLVVVLAVGGWFAWGKFSGPSSKGIQLGVVARTDIIQRVTISGLVVAQRTSSITSPYDSGYIQKIFVSIGQQVKQGDPIITITQTPDGRMEEVFPLRAPFSGWVVQILKTEGANVSKTGNETSLVRIDDTSKLFVTSDTPELDYPKLKIGQEAIIKASSLPDRNYSGKIISLFQAARDQERYDRSRVEFPIRVEILDKDAAIKPGMSVTMDIISAEARGVLSLRHDYVGKDKEGYYIIKESGDKQRVKVGMRSEEAFEIAEGVSEGEKVRQVDFLTTAKTPSMSSSRRNR